MKTINISDELYDKLLEISKELNTQNHLGTAMPYLFQVRDFKRMPTLEGVDVKGYEFVNSDLDSSFDEPETKEELKKIVEEEFESSDEELPSDFNELSERELESILEEKFWYEKYPYTEIEVFNNGFFTKKAIDSHIASNKHNYTKPTPYLNHLERNREMETILEFLCQLSGGEIHK